LTGIDLSSQAIAFARAFNPGLEIFCGDVSSLWPDTYKCVTLIEVLEHIPDDEMSDFLKKVVRIVQSDGYLVISVPTLNIPTSEKHYRHYSLELVQDTIRPYLEIEEYWWLYRQGVLEKIERRLICNAFYVLNYRPFLSLVWQFHKRYTFYANQTNGTHLVCLARPRANKNVR
jgi:SAM-dependent methyltransferase